jgi:hypothetical protein
VFLGDIGNQLEGGISRDWLDDGVRNSITVHYLDQAIGVIDLSFGKHLGEQFRVLAPVSHPVR